MDAEKFSPIAIFAYKREQSLRRLLTSLFACPEFRFSRVTIFVDGPKGPSDTAGVCRVRDYVLSLNLPNVTAVFSDTNKGLKHSIYAGVSSVCVAAGRVVVLEDDMVVSPNALRYFNTALTRYENATSIWAIIGYIYDAPVLRNYERALVLPFAHPWGWATWKRAWDKFSINIEIKELDLHSAAFAAMFDMNGLYPFSNLLKMARDGKVDSWFILWLYTIFENGGRSIFPPRRVVENHGLSDGTHGTSLNPYNWLITRPELLTRPVVFPERLDVDYWALDELRRCYELRVQRMIAWAGNIRRLG